MQLFYIQDTGSRPYRMDPDESRHCIKVLRMKRGDRVFFTDGKGALYESRISDPDPGGCGLEIINVRNDFEKRNYRLHIGISPVKNHDRLEWFVEKCVEIGIDEITPVICRNTEKPGIKKERINNLILSAMKQSLKTFRPVLNDPVEFGEFITRPYSSIRMIAHCNPERQRQGIKDICHKESDILIMIGPEGDFSEDEIIMAEENGFSPVHLGSSRLRTETAGIAACHSVYLINQ